jgi:hypothetical protein
MRKMTDHGCKLDSMADEGAVAQGELNPMPQRVPRHLAAVDRCGARTRTGRPCQQPQVADRRRCRLHGGAPGSGAPTGERNVEAARDGSDPAVALRQVSSWRASAQHSKDAIDDGAVVVVRAASPRPPWGSKGAKRCHCSSLSSYRLDPERWFLGSGPQTPLQRRPSSLQPGVPVATVEVRPCTQSKFGEAFRRTIASIAWETDEPISNDSAEDTSDIRMKALRACSVHASYTLPRKFYPEADCS